jgi:hypothetical protein
MYNNDAGPRHYEQSHTRAMGTLADSVRSVSLGFQISISTDGGVEVDTRLHVITRSLDEGLVTSTLTSEPSMSGTMS